MYPTSLISAADYVNKGEVAPTESHTIPSVGTYPVITLTYIPQGRTVTSLGVTIPSSISIKSSGGTVFSEVFDQQSLTAKTFYADPLNKAIYFSAADSGLVVSVDYLTRGDIIDADIVNNIQNDLRSLEMFKAGKLALEGGTGVVNLSSYLPATPNPTDMVVVATTSLGAVPTHTVNTSAKTVTFTGVGTETVNYIIYVTY